MASSCPFCHPDRPLLFEEDDGAFALYDAHPVSEGHVLVLPERHVKSIFDLKWVEQEACAYMVGDVKEFLEKEYGAVAFNIGFNDGEAAGQTILHAHIHVIPRYEGDVEDPRGGLRHLMPGKGYY
ncbi:MAG: HIT family protein [Flavobacteriales bacterium]